jgi:hypothetical protein
MHSLIYQKKKKNLFIFDFIIIKLIFLNYIFLGFYENIYYFLLFSNQKDIFLHIFFKID